MAQQNSRQRRWMAPMQPLVGKVDQLLSNDEPLDEIEQQEIISGLETAAMQQAHTFRLLFAAAAFLLALLFAYAAVQHYQHPWEQKYTGELRPVTSFWGVTAMLCLQAAGLAAAGLGLVQGLPQRTVRSTTCTSAVQQSRALIAASLLASSFGCCYWSAALYESINRYGYATGAKWDLLWLPLGPVGYSTLCWHVLTSLEVTNSDLQQLKTLAYNCKKV